MWMLAWSQQHTHRPCLALAGLWRCQWLRSPPRCQPAVGCHALAQCSLVFVVAYQRFSFDALLDPGKVVNTTETPAQVRSLFLDAWHITSVHQQLSSGSRMLHRR